MQKEENFHSHDSQLPGSAHVMKRKWHCLLLWIWRGGVGVKPISNSLLSFPIILLLPIYLFISTVFLFFLFSTFNCSLTFSSEFKQKRLLCLLILLLSVSKFHIIYTYKPLLSTSFIEIYQRQGEGKLAWGQIWQKKKKFPYYFQSPGFQLREKENPPGAKLPESARKCQEEKDMRAPAALEQEPSSPGRLNLLLKPESICPVLPGPLERGHAALYAGPSSVPCPFLIDPSFFRSCTAFCCFWVPNC